MKKLIGVLFVIAFLVGLSIVSYFVNRLIDRHYEAQRMKKMIFTSEIERIQVEDIKENLKLYAWAESEGKEYFVKHCESCHGPAGRGNKDVPPLAQGKQLKSGTLKNVATTIRSGYEGVSATFMINYDNQLSNPAISDVADYVLSLSGKIEDAAAIERGKKIFFVESCAACHGIEGKGVKELGVSSLLDNNWLYGGTKYDIMESIRKGRVGLSHAWGNFLEEAKIKMMAVYVWSLR